MAQVFDLLMKHEQAIDLVDRKTLHSAIRDAEKQSVLTLIIFSCLATLPDREELILDFFRTMFFYGGKKDLSRATKKAIQLAQEIERETATKTRIVPILVDTEPRRTWGWKVSQEDLTLSCRLMVEQAKESKILPPNWEPAIWSDLEAQYRGDWTFEKALEIVRQSGRHRLLIDQQEKHLARFADTYYFPRGVRDAAERQVAGYAFEGAVLERVMPSSVLLQSESPWDEKDRLYQWLRSKIAPLAIVHPFSR